MAAPLNSHTLLDMVLEHLNLPNDAALCRLIEVRPPYISKIRNQRVPVPDALLIRLHEETELPISTLKQHIPGEADVGKKKVRDMRISKLKRSRSAFAAERRVS